MLPPVCHPERARKTLLRRIIFTCAFPVTAFLILCLWPISSSRSTIERQAPSLPPKPPSPDSFQREVDREFQQELKKANQTIKNFLAKLEITQDEMLDFATDEHEKDGFSYVTYHASFFLNSFSRSHQIWKKFEKEKPSFQGEKFRMFPVRPMPNTLAFSVEVLGIPTHELMFYFPAEDWKPTRPKPRIAIVMDDLGSNWEEIETLLKIHEPISLAILPHTPFALSGARLAHKKGRPVLLHLPMQPEDYEKINTNDFLTVKMGSEDLWNALEGNHELLSYCVGVNNHMGSRFTKETESMTFVLQYLQKKNLFFLDSRTTNETVGFRLARNMGLPSAMRDVFLDHDPNPKAIARQFQVLRKIARKKGVAIAIGHPHPQTLQLLQAEVKKLREEGFDLVPITKVL